MGITASQVKELREKTGAGMMDCKKALVESGGDEEKQSCTFARRPVQSRQKGRTRHFRRSRHSLYY